MTAETITRVIDEARGLLEGKEGLEEYLAELEAYLLSPGIDRSVGASLSFRLGSLVFVPGDAKAAKAANKLLALINLKQGDETGPVVREQVYQSAWERL